MKRIIIAGTIVLLVLITLGSIFRIDHPLLALASLTVEYNLIRVSLILLLAALFLTSPPRSMYFRVVLSAVSTALFIGSTAMMMDYRIGIVDAIVFIQVAAILAIEAAEVPLLRPVSATKTVRRSS